LKENSSPDSIALLNNQKSFGRSDGKNQVDGTLYSSDLELELPAQFGRRSASLDQVEKDLDDRENSQKSIAKINGINSENQECSHDEMKQVLTDLKLPANQIANVEFADSGEIKSKEIPKKRYILFDLKL
jgi:hypothetical protein